MGILKFKNNSKSASYLTVSVLGKALKLNINYINTSNIELNKNDYEINLYLPKIYKNNKDIDVINLAIQKLYDKISETEIEYAMEVARHILNFAPEDYSIKRLNDSFYKCSKNKIIINPDIVKFNRDIINTTVIQAFCKIKYKTNSISYKTLLNDAMNKYDTQKNSTNKIRILKVS